MEKQSVFCIRCDDLYLERFREPLQTLQQNQRVEILKDYSTLKPITEVYPAVLLATVRTSADLKELLQALQSQSAALVARRLVVIVVQSGLQAAQEKILAQAGVKEILLDRVDSRGVHSKVDRYLKMVLHHQHASPSEESTKPEATGISQASALESASLEWVDWIDPLSISQDYWMIPPKRPVQRNLGRWRVAAVGPSPDSGVWTPHSVSPKCFRFEVKKNNRWGMETSSGHWLFYGNRPEYQSEIQRWVFVGEQPRLDWINTNGAVVASRFFFDSQSKKVLISKNSVQTADWIKKLVSLEPEEIRLKDDRIVQGGTLAHLEVDPVVELEKKLDLLIRDISPEAMQVIQSAKSELKPRSESFAKVEPSQLNRFLNVAGQFGDRGILWLGGNAHLSDLRVYQVDLPARLAEVTLVPPRADPLLFLDESIAQKEDKKIYVNIKMLETSLFFYADRDKITCEEGLLRIPIPDFAYEVQRRGGFRLVMSSKIKGLELTRIPAGATGTWKVMDLSPGGIGLEVSGGLYPFDKSKSFEIEISIQGIGLPLTCTPRWIKSPDAKGKVRVGARFEKISQAILDKLEIYIMEKYLDRFRQGIGK